MFMAFYRFTRPAAPSRFPATLESRRVNNGLGGRGFVVSSASALALIAAVAGPAAAQQKKAAPTVKKTAAAVKAPQPVVPVRPDASPFTSVKRLQAFMEHLKAEAKEAAEEAEEKKGEAKPGGGEAGGSEEERERKSGVPEYLESYLYRLRERAYPYDSIDSDAYVRAADARSKMPAADWNPRTARTLNPNGAKIGPMALAVARQTRWEYVGPRNLPVPYQTYYGPIGSATSGRVNGAAFATNDDNIAYIATAGGGVWKTLNNGRDWFALGDGFDFLYTSAVAVDPTNANIVYVGLGDYDGNNGRGYTGGVMKSTDAGRTWARVGATIFPKAAVSSIAIDPDNPQIIVAATGRTVVYGAGHLFRSTDGGATWAAADTQGGDVEWSDVRAGVKDPATGTRYYYAVTSFANSDALAGIYRSANQGATWTKINLATPFSGDRLTRVAPSQADFKSVYVINTLDNTIYKGTLTSGATYSWTNITGTYASNNWSQAYYYNLALGISSVTSGSPPAKTDVLYGSGISFSGSPGAAGAWTDIGVTYTNGARTHNDQHAIAVSPLNPNKLLIGNDGGVYGVTYNPAQSGATAWTIDATLSFTLGLTQIYHADWHPTDPAKMIGGAQDNATPVAVGLNATTGLPTWKNVVGGDGGGSSINQTNGNYQYATSQYGTAYATNNGWVSSRNITPSIGNDNQPFVTTTAVDPNGLRFYVGTNYLYRYNESTLTWENRLGGQALTTSGTITAIAVAPGDSNTIYTGSGNGALWMTVNGGANWTQLSNGTGALPNRPITSIAINPNNKNDILIGLSGTGTGHLYRGVVASGQATFASVSGSGATALPDFPLNDIARDPVSPASVFYAATDGGVFTSTNGGANWTNATAPLGLPNVECTAIKAVLGTNFVNVATYGRGFWRIPLLSAQEAPAAKPLVTTNYTIARVGANFAVTLTLANGGGAATNVQVNTARITSGATILTPTETLPSVVETIATGKTATKTLTFPAGTLTAGTRAVLSVDGVYVNGVFSSGLRITLP